MAYYIHTAWVESGFDDRIFYFIASDTDSEAILQKRAEGLVDHEELPTQWARGTEVDKLMLNEISKRTLDRVGQLRLTNAGHVEKLSGGAWAPVDAFDFSRYCWAAWN